MANITVTASTSNVNVNSTTNTVDVTTTTSNVVVGTTTTVSNAVIRTAITGTDPIDYNSTTGVISVNNTTLLSGQTTTNLTEGSNLYYTDARVQAYIGGNVLNVNSNTQSGIGELTYNNAGNFANSNIAVGQTIFDGGNFAGNGAGNVFYDGVNRGSLTGISSKTIPTTATNPENVFFGTFQTPDVGGVQTSKGVLVHEKASFKFAKLTPFDGNNARITDYASFNSGTSTINAVSLNDGHITAGRISITAQPGNITTVGNITGAYLYGDGSNITGVSTLTNAQVQTFIESNGLDGTADITTTGTVTAGYLAGDGSNISNIDQLTNAQAQAYIQDNGLNGSGDVTMTGTAAFGNSATQTHTFTGNVDVTGNIEVSGNLNYRNVEDLYVRDQSITLNANAASDATVSIIANRPVAGSNTVVRWNETSDIWEFTNDGSTYYPIPTSTSDLAEGTNLYYTDARSRGALSVSVEAANAGGDLSYNSSTGVFSYTPPQLSNFIDLNDLSVTTNTASGNGSLTYNSGTGVFTFTPADADASRYGDSNVVSLLAAFGSNTITTTGNITGGYITAGNDAGGDGIFIGDINGAIQQEVKNDTGSTLNKGKAVYLTGAVTGDTPHVALANAENAAHMPAIGVIKNNIPDTETGEIVTGGQVNIGTHGFTIGSQLFINGAGDLTETIPTGEGNLVQKIGKVVNATQIIVQGAGRSNATPNLDNNKIFIGNAANRATTVDFSNPANTAIGNYTGNMLNANYIGAHGIWTTTDALGTTANTGIFVQDGIGGGSGQGTILTIADGDWDPGNPATTPANSTYNYQLRGNTHNLTNGGIDHIAEGGLIGRDYRLTNFDLSLNYPNNTGDIGNIHSVNNISTVSLNATDLVANGNVRTASLNINQAFLSNSNVEVLDVTSSGYAPYIHNILNQTLGGDGANYSGSTSLNGFLANATVTAGNSEVVITGIGRQYQYSAAAQSPSALFNDASNITTILGEITANSVVKTGQLIGMTQAPFAKGTYITGVDAANAKITVSKNPIASSNLTVATGRNADSQNALWIGHGARNDSLNYVEFYVSYADLVGNATDNPNFPYYSITTTLDQFGAPPSGFTTSELTYTDNLSGSDFTVSNYTSSGKTIFNVDNGFMNTPDGLTVGDSTTMGFRSFADSSGSTFGLNVGWDGVSTASDYGAKAAPVPQIGLGSYVDNTTQEAVLSVGPRIFMQSRNGNVNISELDQYPRSTQELGRISFYGTHGNNPNPPSLSSPGYISFAAADDWTDGSNTNAYLVATSNYTSTTSRDPFLSYEKGELIIASGQPTSVQADIRFAPAVQVSSNPQNAYDFSSDAAAAGSKGWASINYANVTATSGAKFSVNNGMSLGAGTVGDMQISMHRKDNSYALANATVVPTAFFTTGTAGLTTDAVGFTSGSGALPRGVDVTFSGVTQSGWTFLNGNTYVLTDVGFGTGYSGLTQSGSSVSQGVGNFEPISPASAAGQYEYRVAQSSGVTNKEYKLSLAEQSENLKLTVEGGTNNTPIDVLEVFTNSGNSYIGATDLVTHATLSSQFSGTYNISGTSQIDPNNGNFQNLQTSSGQAAGTVTLDFVNFTATTEPSGLNRSTGGAIYTVKMFNQSGNAQTIATTNTTPTHSDSLANGSSFVYRITQIGTDVIAEKIK